MSAFSTLPDAVSELLNAAAVHVSHVRAGSRVVILETTQHILESTAVEYSSWRLADVIAAIRKHRSDYAAKNRGRSCECDRCKSFKEVLGG